MDELNVFEEYFNSNKKRTNTQKSSLNAKKTLKRKKNSLSSMCSSMVSSDDGIGLTSDSQISYNSMNDSIAQRIKSRSNHKIRENSKQFDSGFFFDRVVDQIAHKVFNYLFFF